MWSHRKNQEMLSKKGRGNKTIWRNNGQHFYKLMKTVNTQIKGTQKISSRRNIRKTILNHLKIKSLQSNAKEKILKPARGKSLITYSRTEKKVTSGISSETMYAGKEIN